LGAERFQLFDQEGSEKTCPAGDDDVFVTPEVLRLPNEVSNEVSNIGLSIIGHG
jgi:hypothetical protein